MAQNTTYLFSHLRKMYEQKISNERGTKKKGTKKKKVPGVYFCSKLYIGF